MNIHCAASCAKPTQHLNGDENIQTNKSIPTEKDKSPGGSGDCSSERLRGSRPNSSSTTIHLSGPTCPCLWMPRPRNGNKPFPNPSERLQRHLSVQYSREERHSNKPQVNCVFTFFPLTKSSSLLLSKLLFSFHVVFWAIPCCLFFFFPICTNEKPELLVSRTLNSWKIFCHCCSTRTRLGTMWKTS